MAHESKALISAGAYIQSISSSVDQHVFQMRSSKRVNPDVLMDAESLVDELIRRRLVSPNVSGGIPDDSLSQESSVLHFLREKACHLLYLTLVQKGKTEESIALLECMYAHSVWAGIAYGAYLMNNKASDPQISAEDVFRIHPSSMVCQFYLGEILSKGFNKEPSTGKPIFDYDEAYSCFYKVITDQYTGSKINGLLVSAISRCVSLSVDCMERTDNERFVLVSMLSQRCLSILTDAHSGSERDRAHAKLYTDITAAFIKCSTYLLGSTLSSAISHSGHMSESRKKVLVTQSDKSLFDFNKLALGALLN